ncbi:hypothetical protein CEXT_123741 [Caerostris extrusa]|uniref:Uncharacterized protein n=1 Tax=Caerostris extrusa TaxID=172846 RepID=A0AAV4NZ37_CAEEX|nr:hypothetical protein CEXT_123741 [Caerostris extrusa]
MVTDFSWGLFMLCRVFVEEDLLPLPHLIPAPSAELLICPPGRFMGYHENSGRDLLTGHRPFHFRIYWYDDSGLLCSTFMKCAYIGGLNYHLDIKLVQFGSKSKKYFIIYSNCIANKYPCFVGNFM